MKGLSRFGRDGGVGEWCLDIGGLYKSSVLRSFFSRASVQGSWLGPP